VVSLKISICVLVIEVRVLFDRYLSFETCETSLKSFLEHVFVKVLLHAYTGGLSSKY